MHEDQLLDLHAMNNIIVVLLLETLQPEQIEMLKRRLSMLKRHPSRHQQKACDDILALIEKY